MTFCGALNNVLPERSRIGIFNRSYYEEILVTHVHPEIVIGQNIAGARSLSDIDEEFWQHRFHSMNQIEQHLVRNGTVILKFFLHFPKEEQKQRFLKRTLIQKRKNIEKAKVLLQEDPES